MKNLGFPYPLGLSFSQNMAQFALYAPQADSVSLIVYKHQKEFKQFDLDPELNKTGGVWHIALDETSVLGLEYSYLINQRTYILDPYARFLNTSSTWGQGCLPKEVKAVVKKPVIFDWQDTKMPKHTLIDLVIYEMHVRCFTINSDSLNAGTFLGVVDKIPYLKSLGVNALELMPVFEFNECEHKLSGLYNVWGYSPVSFFSLMNRYSKNADNCLEEFKTMVRELHKADIKVIIDVVYNHTAEGGSSGPCYNFKQIFPRFYIKDAIDGYVDYSGCGNTINANYWPVMNLIIDSLRFLAAECHVDGFRFDLASTFYRDEHGTCQSSKIMDAIIADPVLQDRLLIAEAWDASGLYQVGHTPLPFADWNGFYRDKVRAFMRIDPHSKGPFADAISGSCSLFYQKSPDRSINFITAHDGFTLMDLFSYNEKHNMANGELNKDGTNQNLSFNCGHEGPSDDDKINSLRSKLHRAAYAILFMSLGTPMILMGDEYGHTRKGNNNAWCHDNDLNHFDWSNLSPEMIRYIHKLIETRQKIPRLKKNQFYSKDEVTWHCSSLEDPKWDQCDGFLALHIHHEAFLIFNMSYEKKQVIVPKGTWIMQIDSANPFKNDGKILEGSALVESHSCVVLTKT